MPVGCFAERGGHIPRSQNRDLGHPDGIRVERLVAHSQVSKSRPGAPGWNPRRATGGTFPGLKIETRGTRMESASSDWWHIPGPKNGDLGHPDYMVRMKSAVGAPSTTALTMRTFAPDWAWNLAPSITPRSASPTVSGVILNVCIAPDWS